ncbi:MAG: oxidoreductase [Acidobacteria bacterium]|nr:MAG: oxidoreductase [Acidobacteriota bacterium]
MRYFVLLILLLPAFLALSFTADLKVGIVGTDTSHATAFTRLLNDASSPAHIPGARVVAAFKGGSPDVESSATRVDRFAQELKDKWQVEIVPDIPTLCSKVDAVLLESVDGRVHLEQARQIFAARKPVFIDKPLASTLQDAREIARLAREAGVPWFTSSSLRWSEAVTQVAGPGITGAITWGPGPLEEHHQLDLSWYAIHPIEMLYTLLGTGCEEVTRTYTEGADVVVGKWKDGRIGVVRAVRPYSDYGAVVFRGEKSFRSSPDAKHDYRPLVVEIVKFFQTGKPPVPNDESLEIFAFIDAAQRSKPDGRPVKLASLN